MRFLKNNDDNISMIKKALDMKLPLMINGRPGDGKAQEINNIAENMDYEVITVISPLFEMATPTFDLKNFTPKFQEKVLKEKKVFLILDEWTQTSSQIQEILTNLLTLRVFPNGVKVPDETIIIGVMNTYSEYEFNAIRKENFVWVNWN